MKAVIAAIGLALSAAACGTSAASRSQSQPTSATPMTAAKLCSANAFSLLNQAVTAVQDGYTDGLSIDSVANQYGSSSATFKVFAITEAMLLGNISTNGSVGSVAPVVTSQCKADTAP